MSRDSRLRTENNRSLEKLKPEFETMFHSFYSALCFFAFRLTNDGPAAQDIVTEVYVRYWEKQADFKALYSVKAFLYVSTRNACLNHNGRVNHQSRIKEHIEYATQSPWLSLKESIYKDVLFLVHTIIDELPDRCKEVISMIYVKGKEIWEIAEQMKISEYTVRNHKSRGIQLIKNSKSFQLVKVLYESLYEQRLGMSSNLYSCA